MTDYICTRADKIYKAGIAVAQTPRGVVINVRKPDHPFDEGRWTGEAGADRTGA